VEQGDDVGDEGQLVDVVFRVVQGAVESDDAGDEGPSAEESAAQTVDLRWVPGVHLSRQGEPADVALDTVEYTHDRDEKQPLRQVPWGSKDLVHDLHTPFEHSAVILVIFLWYMLCLLARLKD